MGEKNELEVALKLGLPEWSGFAAKFEMKFRRLWSERGERFVSEVVRSTELDPAALEERLLEDEETGDLFRRSLWRAAEVSDPEYIEALARAVAGAVDAATLDIDAYIVREITKLEPAQLRVFLACFAYARAEDPHEHLNSTAPDAFDLETPVEGANVATAPLLTADVICARVPAVNGDLSFAALEQLASAGFLVKHAVGDVRLRDYPVSSTGLGLRALMLMFPEIETIEADDRGERKFPGR